MGRLDSKESSRIYGGDIMLACGRCKKPQTSLKHSVWKSGKHIGVVSILVCEDCWKKARKLKISR